MNKVFVTLVLALSVTGMAQGNPQSTPTPQAGAPASDKVIKDPKEFDTYMAALNTQDPAQKAKLMDTFVVQYPQSIVKGDALDYAMAGYQQTGNAAKAEAMAEQIVAANPDHYRALLIIAYAKRASATQQTDPKQVLALATEAQAAAEHALQVLPNAPLPAGVSKEDFDKQRAQMEVILHGVAGFGLLQAKDYAKARDHYLKSDLTDLQSAFQLSLCELELNPIDINGFWHVVKAAKLAETQGNTVGAQQIAAYGKGKYRKYHGSNDGWDAFVAKTAAQASLPAELTDITRAPTPCEIAVQVVKDAEAAGSVKSIEFPDRETVLQFRDCSPANKAAADKIWSYITHDMQQDGEVKIKLASVKVIAVGTDSVDVALTPDNQDANKADIHVVLEKPETKPRAGKKAAPKPPVLKLPAVGSLTEVTGVFTGYTPDPFLFTMEKGELPPPARPKVTPKGAAGKKAGSKKKK
ncbi:MAG TPA: hypothetical protein VNW97_16595 [Candidatus Saccharimonadales bacterium]|jgi:hypothetical protein|nr:hypothetical protein [Candidatus Saccharimonadales bacterium]